MAYTKWTRELIVRDIVARDASRRPLNLGGHDGVGQALYQAASRIFGSWTNAVRAAGVAGSRAQSGARWTPGKILSTIRALARRRRRGPMRGSELPERHRCL